MSRSFRKTPIRSVCCCESEKEDKQFANRKYRKKSKQALISGKEMPLVKEVSNRYYFGKDGKIWWGWRRPRFPCNHIKDDNYEEWWRRRCLIGK